MLGPKFYTMYTTLNGASCKKYGLEYPFYADDSSLYLSFKPTNNVSKTEAIRRVEASLLDAWKHAKQNADKTEVIVFTSERNSSLVSEISVTVGDSNIKFSSSVRNLGAWLDSGMDMEQHVNSVCKSCFGQIRQISHIRHFLTTDATKSLVNSLVTSRLDYCICIVVRCTKDHFKQNTKHSKYSCTHCDQDISFLSYNSCIERTSLATYTV